MRHLDENIASEWADLYLYGWNIKDIAKPYHVQIKCVSYHLKRLGIDVAAMHRSKITATHRMLPRKWECFKHEWLDLHAYGFSTGTIADFYDLDGKTIWQILKHWGIKQRTKSEAIRKYSIKEDFFRTIDTEEKAYWLGFLAADGNVNKDLSRVSLLLAKRDIEHLEKFRSHIGSSHPITTGLAYLDYENNIKTFPYCKIEINCQKMAFDLNSLGLTPNKSLSLKPPTISTIFERHFWRGALDGDGCLSFYKNGDPAICLIGSPWMCEGFGKFIENELGYSYNVRTHGDNILTKRLQHSCGKGKATIKLLYENTTVYLNRKMLLATKAIAYCKPNCY